MLFFVLIRKGFEMTGELLPVDQAVVALVESFILGIYVAAVAPWIFRWFRLAKKEIL
jgi:hypothetical protein